MKTPTYAVIRVNSAGEAKITKQWSGECNNVANMKCSSWRDDRRNARIAGMRYFRLKCLSVDGDIWWVNPEHAKIDGTAFHISEIFSCRCCYPEWLFSDGDIAQAEKEIASRKSTSHTIL